MVGAVEMVQRVKVTVTKSDNMRSFPRIHRGRSPTLQLYSDLLVGYICSHRHTNWYTRENYSNNIFVTEVSTDLESSRSQCIGEVFTD